LVHWPIIVFSSALGWAQYALLLLLPILLSGYILHVLVERRRNFGYKFTAVYFGLALAINTVDSKDLISTYKEQSSDMYELYGGKYIREGESLLVGTSEPAFILHGDSHARELVQALVDRGLSFITNNKDGCYSIGLHSKIKVESDSNSYELELKCNNFYKRSKLLANHYQNIPIVVAQNWTTYGKSVPLISHQNDKPFHLIEDFESLVEPSKHEQFLYSDLLKLAQDFPDRTIYIIGKKQENPYYDTNNLPNQTLISSWAKENLSSNQPKHITAPFYQYSINNELKSSIKTINELRESGDALAKLIYVEPSVYCNNNECDLFVGNGIQIYNDSDHYSWAGSVKAVSNLLNYMKIEKGTERTNFSSLPDIDFNELQTVLEYSEESGFKFPDKK
ncbi:SGNH hydrolase domain-containing protein, partial [Anaerobiospirillum succiniciproducens]|uniref:SGNH hydrolase domain-containing protein n=1 Tax=Anaerobiospirillum succiniciproducens TaxID=13335 RepID=UPI0023542ED3